MTITLRPLPTAYDPPDHAVSVATPSCCCCCCCCLATITGVSTFIGTEAYYRAAEQPATHPRRWWVFLLGFVSLVLGPLAFGWAIGEYWGYLLLLAPVLAWSALAAAGANKGSATLLVLATFAIGAVAFVAEFALALGTVLFIELVTPFAIWAGWGIARRRHRKRTAPIADPAFPPIPPITPMAPPVPADPADHDWFRPDQPPPPPTMS